MKFLKTLILSASIFSCSLAWGQPTFNYTNAPLSIASGSSVFFPYQILLPNGSYTDNGATGTISFVSPTGSSYLTLAVPNQTVSQVPTFTSGFKIGSTDLWTMSSDGTNLNIQSATADAVLRTFGVSGITQYFDEKVAGHDAIQYFTGKNGLYYNIGISTSAGGPDFGFIGIGVGSLNNSGLISVAERSQALNRGPGAGVFYSDPHLRVWSGNSLNANDYIEFYHNQTNAVIKSGTGTIDLSTNNLTNIGTLIGNTIVSQGDATASVLYATTAIVNLGTSTSSVVSVKASGGNYYLPYSSGSTGQTVTLQTNGTSIWQTPATGIASETDPVYISQKANYVPYSGATGTVTLGNWDLSTASATSRTLTVTTEATSPIINVGTKYQFPTVAGATGQVLTANSGQKTLWQTPSTATLTETDPVWSGVKANYVPYSGATGAVNIGSWDFRYAAATGTTLNISTETVSTLNIKNTATSAILVATTSSTSPIIRPSADSTTAIKITKADGSTAIETIDTINNAVIIGSAPATVTAFDVAAASSNNAKITVGSTAFAYQIWRNNSTGTLSLQGSQASFTGYDFLNSDGTNMFNILTNGNISTPFKITTYNNVVTQDYGVPAIVTGVHSANNSASITSTNFTNAGTAGTYRVSYEIQGTASDAGAGSTQLDFTWTDAGGAKAYSDNVTITIDNTANPPAASTYRNGVFYLQLASGSVAYKATVTGTMGAARYRVDLECERTS